jgi:hypothetical protein
MRFAAHPSESAAGARDAQHAVFVSYRRDECAQAAGRLFDWLERHLGAEQVFIDLELDPGVEFSHEIERVVGACRVVLAVIGPTWDQKRLRDPHDLLRRELEIALRSRDIQVIPVLVQGARMPEARKIPDTLAPLLQLQAVTLTDDSWRRDIPRLLRSIDRILAHDP